MTTTEGPGALRLRFPSVPLPRPHYESVYCVLVHPSEPSALWLRTTVRKPPGQPARGAVWVTWFGADGVRATKVDDVDVAPDTPGLRCGPASLGPTGSRGEVIASSLDCRWDLSFAPRTARLEHLRPAGLYRAPLPRTKATSPLPDLDVTGMLVADGRPVDLTGWTGMLGHNWGSEHAARWLWLRAAGLGTDGTGWLDVIAGRVRIGSVLSPWTAFGALELDGARHRLGGLLSRGADVRVEHDGAVVRLPGRRLLVAVRASVEPQRVVAWEYADPGGGRHEVVNCSVARLSLDVDVRGTHRVLEPARRGVLELGGDERAFDVPLQPHRD